MIVLPLTFMASIAQAAPATQPTPKAAARAEQLKAGVKTFTLTLNYRGDQDKPYYGLTLSVQPIYRARASAFQLDVQISEEQATKLIGYLATEGFLDQALDANRNASPMRPKEPYYVMVVRVEGKPDAVQFEGWLGFDMNMLKRLDGLRAVLDGDAAKKMDLLLGRLSGHRKQWEAAAAIARPTDLTMTSEPVTENGAEFQTVAQTKWPLPISGEESSIQIGLNVTNRTEKMIQINLFDTVRVVLTDVTGREMRIDGGRNRTRIPEPLILQSGGGKVIAWDAKLERLDGDKGLRLIGSDGAGGIWYFDGLRAGRYTVNFVLENDEQRMRAVVERPAKHVIDPKKAPFWMGKVTTKAVAVEIVPKVPP